MIKNIKCSLLSLSLLVAICDPCTGPGVVAAVFYKSTTRIVSVAAICDIKMPPPPSADFVPPSPNKLPIVFLVILFGHFKASANT